MLGLRPGGGSLLSREGAGSQQFSSTDGLKVTSLSADHQEGSSSRLEAQNTPQHFPGIIKTKLESHWLRVYVNLIRIYMRSLDNHKWLLTETK